MSSKERMPPIPKVKHTRVASGDRRTKKKFKSKQNLNYSSDNSMTDNSFGTVQHPKKLAPIPQKSMKATPANFNRRRNQSETVQGYASSNQLQNVEQFRNFLLQNDSHFADYLNSDLLKSTFDTHMMKEGMITFMAQMMGNGSAKDNFFLKTRTALQDTLTLFFITRNISFNNNIEFYLPRLVEMVSDLIEVERCSIFLYDGIKDQLYCKVITGRLREAISFDREKPNILSTVFNTGQAVHIANCQDPKNKDQLGDYLQINQKLHCVTRNVLVCPIKLGNNAIGCIEVANKRKSQDFNTNDISLMTAICDQISNGLIAHEMKYNIKKETDEELRHVKGLINQSFNQFLVPMISEVTALCTSVLKSERVLFFMYNKEIDHLYTISAKSNQVGQFTFDTVRMRSSLGLSGAAFTQGRIMIEKDVNGADA